MYPSGSGSSRESMSRAGRWLVGDRKRVRLLGDDSPRDPENGVERRVQDHEWEDESARDSGGTIIQSVDEQPEQVRKPADEEELRDVQPDEHTRSRRRPRDCRCAGARGSRRGTERRREWLGARGCCARLARFSPDVDEFIACPGGRRRRTRSPAARTPLAAPRSRLCARHRALARSSWARARRRRTPW